MMWTPQNRKPYDRVQLDAIRMTDHELGVDRAGEPEATSTTINPREAINGSCPSRALDASGERRHSVRCCTHHPDIQDRDGGILPLATLFGRYPL
jgi:hypothetical protein